jgi:hypothetical protein
MDGTHDPLIYRPMKPLKRMRPTARAPNFHHTNTNSGSSVASFNSDISMINNELHESPRIHGLALNLGSQTTDFSKMKLF